jgi:hypothetical protein
VKEGDNFVGGAGLFGGGGGEGLLCLVEEGGDELTLTTTEV